MGKDDYEANPRKDEIEDIGKPGQAAIYDDVFGDISEGGPNYRDVSCFVFGEYLTSECADIRVPGGRVWNHCPTDEDPAWAWSTIHPICL